MATIVFGVLLALGLAEWRDSAQQRQRQQVALETIRLEVADNRRAISDRLPYYAEIAATLGELAADEEAGFSAVPGWRGLMPALLRSSAYDTAVATGVLSELDFALAAKIAHVYALQGIYSDLIRAYGGALLAGSLDSHSRLRGLFADLHSNGGELDRAYGQILERLDVELESAATDSRSAP